ncbi:hypothetical protein F0562_013538 [Nyssa sinensis]|uniref:Uncharacterized protein n=1 Tax=Nyssa sinensis TaxID=561372 RepID=A0A5J4ZP68_9ASTE|nr:hypothetical protein F0562_013538 [Nyssa sinensis]
MAVEGGTIGTSGAHSRQMCGSGMCKPSSRCHITTEFSNFERVKRGGWTHGGFNSRPAWGRKNHGPGLEASHYLGMGPTQILKNSMPKLKRAVVQDEPFWTRGALVCSGGEIDLVESRNPEEAEGVECSREVSNMGSDIESYQFDKESLKSMEDEYCGSDLQSERDMVLNPVLMMPSQWLLEQEGVLACQPLAVMDPEEGWGELQMVAHVAKSGVELQGFSQEDMQLEASNWVIRKVQWVSKDLGPSCDEYEHRLMEIFRDIEN